MSGVYTVRYAPQALDDLRDLYSYVAFSLKEPATAQKLVNRIRKAARSLDAQVYRGEFSAILPD